MRDYVKIGTAMAFGEEAARKRHEQTRQPQLLSSDSFQLTGNFEKDYNIWKRETFLNILDYQRLGTYPFKIGYGSILAGTVGKTLVYAPTYEIALKWEEEQTEKNRETARSMGIDVDWLSEQEWKEELKKREDRQAALQKKKTEKIKERKFVFKTLYISFIIITVFIGIIISAF